MLLLNPTALLVGTNDMVNPVTSVQDASAKRLQVEASPPGGAAGVLATAPQLASAPATRTVWAPVSNSSGTNLLVNGTAAAPAVFTYPSAAYPLVGNVVISKLRLVYSVKSCNFTGNQITANAALLGLGTTTQALPNGLLFGGTFGGTAVTLAKVQVNEDLFGFNGSSQLTAGDSGRVLIADLLFTQLLGASDQVSVTVQDQMANITTANSMRAFVGGIRLAS